jgi:transposase
VEQGPVIGIDLGVTARSQIAVADGATIVSSRSAASTPKGLTEGIARAAAGREVRIVVESTAMAWFVAAVAALRAGVIHTLYRVSGSKAAALRSFYRSHTKTDHIDARVLARMPAVDDTLRSFELPTSGELALKRLVTLRHKLATASAKLQNQLRSTLHWAAPGLVKASGGGFSDGLLAVLATWPDLSSLARARSATIARVAGFRPERAEAVRQAAVEAVEFYRGQVSFADLALEIKVMIGQLEVIHSQRKGLEERIVALHGEMFAGDPIVSIPGVGPTVAGVVRAVVGNLERFSNLAAFRAYTGLVPREDSSGEFRRRGRISKAGPAVLRWALYLAADVARQWDPQLAELYRRLMVQRGKTHTQALCAVASHLAGRIWAVSRERRDYQWRDLEGNPITREQAHQIAQSLRVDPETRARLRSARKHEGPDAPLTRQHEAPHSAIQPSTDKVIEMALEVARKA